MSRLVKCPRCGGDTIPEAEMPAAPEVITEVKREEEGAEAAGEQKESKEPKEKKEDKEKKK